MPCLVHTARMGYRGADALPVTRKIVTDPLGLAFAPSVAILDPALAAIRAGTIEAHWPTYAAAYVAEMRASYRQRRAAWDEVLARKSVTCLCFCPNPAFCHRRLLADLLGRCGAVIVGERGGPSAAQAE